MRCVSALKNWLLFALMHGKLQLSYTVGKWYKVAEGGVHSPTNNCSKQYIFQFSIFRFLEIIVRAVKMSKSPPKIYRSSESLQKLKKNIESKEKNKICL